MKKLSMQKMETINGGGKNRDCMLLGAIAAASVLVTAGMAAGWGAIALAGLGGLGAGAGSGCFS